MSDKKEFNKKYEKKLTALQIDLVKLQDWVIDQGMDFDQMIWEFPELGKGVNGSWIHISYKSGNNRKKTTNILE